jgi:hypothetical protein
VDSGFPSDHAPEYMRRSRLSHQAESALEHVPTKLHDFVDKDMLQRIESARFLFGEVIPLRWEARYVIVI